MQGLAWTMGCLAEVSYLLHIILFLRIAYGHACPSYAHLIYPMFRYRIIHVPTVTFSIYFFTHERKSLAKITLCVNPDPYATGAACFSQFSKIAQ